jgi:hypothetical protein
MLSGESTTVLRPATVALQSETSPTATFAMFDGACRRVAYYSTRSRRSCIFGHPSQEYENTRMILCRPQRRTHRQLRRAAMLRKDAPMTDTLNPGQNLTSDQSITSQDGRFTLIMQGDGNLVLYGPRGPRWATGTNGRTVAQAVMQGDGNLVMYGPGGEYIWDSATNGTPGAWLLVQNDGNLVIYGPGGNPLWATNTNITGRAVSGFLPSTAGLHFSNSFPAVPHFTINVLGAQVPIGNAANGLCGGMVFTVRDYYEAGSTPPPDTSPPSSGPLYDALVNRLYASFNLPFGPAKYMGLMNPDLPDHETDLSRIGLAPHGRAWVAINEEWPKIRADLDNNRLSPMALVTIKSRDPFQMGQNHQVLAYGYELDLNDLVLRIYDPNSPNNDSLNISMSVADPQHTTTISYSGTLGGDNKVWCFFRPDYTFVSPPGVATGNQWREWESLGGVLSSAPDVTSWADGRLDVFVRGTDSALWHKWFDGNWSHWESLGGVLSSDPSAASWANGRIDAFVRGTDNALWHKWYDGSWSHWESLGGILTSGPDVCSWASGRLDVFVRGTDGALWHKWYDGGWSHWESLGGLLTSDPAAVSWANGRIDVFARGTDNALWHKWYDGSWSHWESLGGVLTSGPDVSSWGMGRLDVFVRGTDSALWHKWFDRDWSYWESLGGVLTTDPATVSWGSGRIDVFARGTDNALWHRWYG